jgi:hypothetical protein
MKDDEPITYESLCLRYPPAVAEFLMKEIAKAEARDAANDDNKPVKEFLAKAVTK